MKYISIILFAAGVFIIVAFFYKQRKKETEAQEGDLLDAAVTATESDIQAAHLPDPAARRNAAELMKSGTAFDRQILIRNIDPSTLQPVSNYGGTTLLDRIKRPRTYVQPPTPRKFF